MTDDEHGPQHSRGHEAGHHPGQPADGHPWGGMADLLDLDGEVLSGYLGDVTTWVADLAAARPVSRVLDVGAGTGTGTFALLERFPDAEAVALDLSPQMLDHLGGRAARLGVAPRVRTRQADLDARWPDLEPVDLAWASSSLHHLADPGRALAQVRDVLRPGGLLAVTEMDSFPRFLPDDVGVGEPGLEARCHAALATARAEQLPHQGSDWAAHLSRAGFTVVADRVFTVELPAPLPEAAGRYAQLSLSRMGAALADRVGAGDRAALDVLLDESRPESVRRRDDLTVRATRYGWVALRP